MWERIEKIEKSQQKEERWESIRNIHYNLVQMSQRGRYSGVLKEGVGREKMERVVRFRMESEMRESKY